jgi:hypothetical protein
MQRVDNELMTDLGAEQLDEIAGGNYCDWILAAQAAAGMLMYNLWIPAWIAAGCGS